VIPGGDANDNFGYDVAITASGPLGVTTAVGAPYFDSTGKTDRGIIYLNWKNAQGQWYTDAHWPSDASAGAAYGWSVDIEGGVLAVGAPYHKPGATETGEAFIYTHNGTDWTQAFRKIGSGGSACGYAVSISGTAVAIGAPLAPYLPSETGGSVLLVRRNTGGSWGLFTHVTLPAGAAGPEQKFGMKVSLDGNRLMVGAPGGDFRANGAEMLLAQQPGTVYLFEQLQVNGSFVQVNRLQQPFPAPTDLFGRALALYGGHYVIGMHKAWTGGLQTGNFLIGAID
jgi:hypothetical protein